MDNNHICPVCEHWTLDICEEHNLYRRWCDKKCIFTASDFGKDCEHFEPRKEQPDWDIDQQKEET